MNLLVTDLHLDDNPDNDYRWNVWEHILQAVIQHRIERVFILGDWVDRKDRFSAAFINRLMTHVYGLAGRVFLIVLRGNHDSAMNPPSYFDFLASPIENFMYVTAPLALHGEPLLLLPFTKTPKEDWSHLNLENYKAAFMHATVTGARVENGMVMENSNFPVLPQQLKVYSGDVHVPQKVRNVTYVGAPHPIKYGDDYPCRMLVLDQAYDITQEISLSPLRKIIVDITDPSELARLQTRYGDRIKIRYACPPDAIGDWPRDEQLIAAWAKEHGITIAGTEVVVGVRATGRDLDLEQTPEQILKDFAAREELTPGLLQTGLDLLAGLK